MKILYFWFIFCLKVYGQEKLNIKWQTDQINVCWINPSTNDLKERKWVEEAIQSSWTAFSDIKFIGWEICDTIKKTEGNGIRILIADQDPSTTDIGVRLDNQKIGMFLNLSFINTFVNTTIENNKIIELQKIKPKKTSEKQLFIKANAVHEFGHALGFCHENDRNECLFKKCTFSDQAINNNSDCLLTNISCDERSVMNYCNNYYLNEGFLTELDVKKLREIYPPKENNFELKQVIQYRVDPTIFSNRKKVTIKIIDNNIDSVIYAFHRTTMKNITAKNFKSNFSTIINGVYGSFMCRATIFYNDGNSSVVSAYICIKGFSGKDKNFNPKPIL